MNKRYALIQRTRITIDIPGAMSPQSNSNLTFIITVTQNYAHAFIPLYVYWSQAYLLIIIIMNNYQLLLLNKQVCVKI